jgi:hypothetical protein
MPLEDEDISLRHRLSEYLDHNELGLAFDELIRLGEFHTAPCDYWQPLLLAAHHMQITEQETWIREKIAHIQALTTHAIVEAIAHACSDSEGFLIKLHAHREFDDARYDKLMRDFTTYATLLGDNTYVHRTVAGYLLAVLQELENQMADLRPQHAEVWRQKIAHAHTHVLDLLHLLLRL